MLGNVKEFVKEWGYWAVFLGSLIEGESVILTASFLAASGLLSIVKIMIVAFTGTLLADQTLFFFGYYYGEGILIKIKNRFPRIEPYMQEGQRLIRKYETPYILSFRFLYGLRIISPVIIGSQKTPIKKFCVLNVVAAALWTLISCLGGYALGDLFLTLSTPQKIIMVSVVVLLLVLWGVRKYFKRKQKKSKTKEKTKKQ